jgi:hypothetical protein
MCGDARTVHGAAGDLDCGAAERGYGAGDQRHFDAWLFDGFDGQRQQYCYAWAGDAFDHGER